MASTQQTSTAKGAGNKAVVRPYFPQDAFSYCFLGQILAFLGVGRSRFYELMAAGKMPRPVINAGRVRTWQVGAIRAAAEKLAQTQDKGDKQP